VSTAYFKTLFTLKSATYEKVAISPIPLSAKPVM